LLCLFGEEFQGRFGAAVGVGAGGTVTSSPAACVAEDATSVKPSTQAGANLERVRVGMDRSPKKNLQLLN
jgi:hypothetical protein